MRLGYGTYKGQGYFRLIPSETEAERRMDTIALHRSFPEKEVNERGILSFPACIESMALIDQRIGLDSLQKTVDTNHAIQRFREKEKERTEKELFTTALYERILLPYALRRETPPMVEDIVLTYEPYSHQQLAFRWLYEIEKECKEVALFAKMGCGKTRITLSWIEYLIETGKMKKALIIAPLYTLHNAWLADSVLTTLSLNVLWSGSSGKKKERELSACYTREAHVDVINIEGIERRAKEGRREYIDTQSYDMVVVDESNNIMSPDGVRFKAACEISEKSKYRMILTGTPSPNGVLNLWAQFFFLDRGRTLGTSFSFYRDQYTYPSPRNRFVRFQYPDAPERIHQLIRKVALIVENDALGLPPRTHILQMITPTQKQRSILHDIEKEGAAIFEYGEEMVEIYCESILQKINKMLQWLNGFAYTEDRDGERKVIVGENPKIHLAIPLIAQLIQQEDNGVPSKVIVWGSYVEEIRQIAEALEEEIKKQHLPYQVVCAYGDLSSKKIMKNMDAFQTDPNTRVIVAHPKSIGEGTNLQAADYMVYLSLVNDLRVFLQSHERNYRGGQTRKVTVYYFVYRKTIEELLLDSLRKKEDIQERIRKGALRGASLHDLFECGDLERYWKTGD